MRFVVISTTNDGCTDALRYKCGLTNPEALHRDDVLVDALTLARSRIELLNPELNIPEVADPRALSILTGIADRIPALGESAGWHVRFGRELNATDDRPHFVKIGARTDVLPVVEGKQLSPFRIDIDKSAYGIPVATAATLIDRASSFDRDRIAYRDVASATNKLTLIAAILPAGTISTHTVFCLKTRLDERSQWALLALLNSLVANYLVRLNVTTHVTAGILSRLRVPTPDHREKIHLSDLARSLTSTGISDWTSYANLNAIAARLYGLTRDEYACILDTFPLLPREQRDRCLETFVAKIKHRNTETQNH